MSLSSWQVAHLFSSPTKFCQPRVHVTGGVRSWVMCCYFLSWKWEAVGGMSTKLFLKCLSLTVTFEYRERHPLKTINMNSLFQWLNNKAVEAPVMRCHISKPTEGHRQDSEWSRCLGPCLWCSGPSAFLVLVRVLREAEPVCVCLPLSLSLGLSPSPSRRLSRLILRHWFMWSIFHPVLYHLHISIVFPKRWTFCQHDFQSV